MEHVGSHPGQLGQVENRSAGVEKPRQERIRIEQHSAAGMLWFIGWLFTIGFLHLSFWKGVLGLLIWPYYIGSVIGPLVSR